MQLDMYQIHCLFLKYLNTADMDFPCLETFRIFVFVSCAKYGKIGHVSKTHQKMQFTRNIFLTLFVK